MVSTFTPNLNLELQGTGDHSGTWGANLNTASLSVVDAAMGDTQTFSLSNANVTVSTAQSQKNLYKLTGLLTANVTITWPAIGRTYFVINSTTGNFKVTLASAGAGTSVVLPQGFSGFITMDGANVYMQSYQVVPVGMVSPFAMSTVPSGWLECNGAAISRTVYSTLFGLIGTTYGSGDGSTTFNIPDLRGWFVRGWSHGASEDSGRVLGSSQANQNLAHTHVFTGDLLPTHTHGIPLSHTAGSGSPLQSNGRDQTIQTDATSAGTPTGTNSSSGGTEARPDNIALMYCIRVV